jgi:hypothetical protein
MLRRQCLWSEATIGCVPLLAARPPSFFKNKYAQLRVLNAKI